MASFLLILTLPMAVYAGVEQIHLGPGMDCTQLNVGWTTPCDPTAPGTDVVSYGLSPLALNLKVAGEATTFLDGAGYRNITMHLATIKDLLPSTRYYYQVSTDQDSSEVFSFMSMPEVGSLKEPLNIILFGDMGASNAQSLPGLIRDVRSGKWTLGLGIGDYAYNMDDNNGTCADDYFNANQPVHAELPFITTPGNHEAAYNFQHYTYRWNTNPVNSGVLPSKAGATVAGRPNNWWYSYDVGNMHVLSYSTEVFFGHEDMLPSMIQWITDDLTKAQANRDEVPWIVMIGHRPNYCSCDGDCDGAATTTRTVLEPIMYKYGVDLVINAHEHNYERLYATYKNTHVTGNGTLVAEPKASVYIITGDAGNSEGHEPFTRPQPDWSAFRSNTFGYSRMTVFNDTHILWEQVMTDVGQPPEQYGQVIDQFWLVQHLHGPFNAEDPDTITSKNALVHEQYLSVKTGLDGPNHKHKHPSFSQ